MYCQEYADHYGEILQAYRPSDIEQLLATELEGMRVEDGMRLLDAGCGFCGPAIYIAQRMGVTIEGLTLGEAMADRARRAVGDAGLSKRIRVRTGDFHELNRIYPARSFDRVYFLETIGYAKPVEAVLRSAWEVLKPGGGIYIKDWATRDFPPGSESERLLHVTRAGVLKEYGYRMYDKRELPSRLTECGYKVRFARRLGFDNDPTWMNCFDRAVGFSWDQFLPQLAESSGLIGPAEPFEVFASRPD